MTTPQNYVALDLGASNGRAVVGRLAGGRLTLHEVHRFDNGPVALPGAPCGPDVSLFWDILNLFSQVKTGIAKARAAFPEQLASVGLDTWGVDYGLLDSARQLLGNPYHYRDSRTSGIFSRAFQRVTREEVFEATGIQFIEFNTLFQLLAAAECDAPGLKSAQTLLMIPDLLNYWLTGEMVSERTIASTSQMLDMRTGEWSRALLGRMGLPSQILPSLVDPGTRLGRLLPHVAEETGASELTVIAPGCHDTASAVAAVPAVGSEHAYLSSGTWSLLGAELKEPVISPRALEFNFTNEGGVCGTIRLLRNISGLWAIQECRRVWAAEGSQLSWDEITRLAAAAPAFTATIDVDAPEFMRPGNMPELIRAHCKATGQRVPEDRGTVARVVFESLALKYRWTLESLDQVMGRRAKTLHIVGGGSRNRLLNQFAANSTGRPVVAGPVEATAIGNLLMQMLAMGAVSSLEEGRAVVRDSFDAESFEPRETAAWDDAYAAFCRRHVRE